MAIPESTITNTRGEEDRGNQIPPMSPMTVPLVVTYLLGCDVTGSLLRRQDLPVPRGETRDQQGINKGWRTEDGRERRKGREMVREQMGDPLLKDKVRLVRRRQSLVSTVYSLCESR